MSDKLSLSSFMKWLAGIAATVIGAALVFKLTGPGGILVPLTPTPTVMDVSGVWLTPFRDLSYQVTQEYDRVSWIVRESGVSGTGTISGNTLVSTLNGEDVMYEAAQVDSTGNPEVLYTAHPSYVGIILFKTCDNFEQFLSNFRIDLPKLEGSIRNALSNIPNLTCSGILP